MGWKIHERRSEGVGWILELMFCGDLEGRGHEMWTIRGAILAKCNIHGGMDYDTTG